MLFGSREERKKERKKLTEIFRMAKEGVYLTPTLSCYGIMLRKPFEHFLSPDCRDKSVEVMRSGLEALKIADAAGVTICYGSDLLISMQALQTGGSTIVGQR
jgi:hypothetical protein